MKAITVHRYGSPDVLEFEELERPVPRDDGVLVRVRAASANPRDWHLMRGLPYVARLMIGLPVGRMLKAVVLSPFVSQRLSPFEAKASAEDLQLLTELIGAGRRPDTLEARSSSRCETIKCMDRGPSKSCSPSPTTPASTKG